MIWGLNLKTVDERKHGPLKNINGRQVYIGLMVAIGLMILAVILLLLYRLNA